MRWFKHLTDAHLDPKLCELRDLARNPLAAMGWYYWLLEIVAKECKENAAYVRLKRTRWAKRMEQNAKTWDVNCTLCAKVGLINVTRDGDYVQIEIPNLLKYRDEYSRKSGHAPDKLPTDSQPRARADQKQNRSEADNARAGALGPAAQKSGPKTKNGGGSRRAPRWSDLENWRLVKLCGVLGINASREEGVVWQELGAKYRTLEGNQLDAVNAMLQAPPAAISLLEQAAKKAFHVERQR